MNPEFIDTLVVKNDTKIIFLIIDGLGGLPPGGRNQTGGGNQTELEAAATPNLDALADNACCGLLDPVGYGITPGSGPSHLALFGYDPIKNNIGRGILEAAGIDFPMTDRDLLIRVNFATVDATGNVIDRRAGRIDNETNKRICRMLKENIGKISDVEIIFEPVREHRALLALRGGGLREEITETDPQKTGVPPFSPKALVAEAEETSAILRELVNKAGEILYDEKKANMLLFRGYSRYRSFPSLTRRYGLNALGIAAYPMYRGIARLLGMAIIPELSSLKEEFMALCDNYDQYDFFFLHVKATDSRGEDGNFDGKVAVIEEVDRLIPMLTKLNPDVLVVTGDHSTPAALAAHSWHPLPVLLSSPVCLPDRVSRFGERDCIVGGLGRMPTVHLMGLALAHARRLEKFGA